MTQYRKTIYLDSDTAWIALDHEIAVLASHSDPAVVASAKSIKRLLSENVKFEQISGNFVDKDGTFNIWIKG